MFDSGLPPSDPLERLGSSLFLSVLSFLPFADLLSIPLVLRSWNEISKSHRSGIWRAACYRSGVDPKDLSALSTYEQAGLGGVGSGSFHQGVDRSILGIGVELRNFIVRDSAISRENEIRAAIELQSNEDIDTVGGPRSPGVEVDWKRVCKAHVELDRNWRFGRCREDWITDGGNAVWRFKVDQEEGTCLMTSRTGVYAPMRIWNSAKVLPSSISVQGINRDTSSTHLTPAASDIAADLTLQVYRTQSAIKRSIHPTPPARSLPLTAKSSISHTHPAWRPEQACSPAASRAGAASTLEPLSSIGGNEGTISQPAQLPRGHLAYYRKITPPTPCIAFRARVDKEGSEDERAVLGTAGEEGVYLWDLEEEARVERIGIPEAERCRIQYIEFDDDHVFLCGETQMHIYSRRTKKKVISFPEIPTTIPGICALAYYVDSEDPDSMTVLPYSPNPVRSRYEIQEDEDLEQDMTVGGEESSASAAPSHAPGFAGEVAAVSAAMLNVAGTIRDGALNHSDHPTLVGRLVSEGMPSHDEEALYVMAVGCTATGREHRRSYPDWPPYDYDFSACHYTSTDLICASRLGQLFIIRDYHALLAIPDAAEREKKWADNTIIIGFGDPIRLLSTTVGGMVSITTPNHVFFFSTSTLPSPPRRHRSTPRLSVNEDSASGNGEGLDGEADGDGDASDNTTPGGYPTDDDTHLLPETEVDGSISPSTIQIHSILTTHSYGTNESSCLQMDSTHMWLTYWAMGESEAGSARRVHGHTLPALPDRAMEGLGMCIRQWEFTPQNVV